MLIPIQCEYYALEGLGQLLSNIDLVRAHLNPGISVRTILLTMYDGRTKLADQVADEVRNHFGDLVLQAVIPRNVRVSEAPGYGQSVLTYDPGSRGSTSYVEAARELAQRGVGMLAARAVPDAGAPAAPPVTALAVGDAVPYPGVTPAAAQPVSTTAQRGEAMTKRGGLGRGLAALIPTGPAPTAVPSPAPADAQPVERTAGSAPTVSLVPPPADTSHDDDAPVASRAADRASAAIEAAVGIPGAQLREVAVDDVVPNPKQPRQVFDDEALEELSHSVREFGLLQPIVVRENAGPPAGVSYELIMGERRLRAARAAGLDTVPAIVRDTTDDAMLRDALLENIHRVQLNPLEEAAAYQQLLEEFGATHEELASKIGRSRSQVTNTIRLMKLPVKVQIRVAAGVISAGHARALLGLPDADEQDALATRIVAEGMSVRATEEAVAMAAAEEPTARRRTRKHHARRAWRTSPAGCRTCSRPRSRSRSAGPRDASSSSSGRSTTCSGSSA